MVERTDNTPEEKRNTGTTAIILVLIVILGGYIIFTEGLSSNDSVTKIFFIYSFLIFTLPVVTLIDINTGVRWFKSFLFKPKISLIHQWYIRNPKDDFAYLLERINNSYLLSFVTWTSLFSIPMFIGSMFAPQSAVGNFFSNYIFPVRPQAIFDIISADLFFTLFPAPSETGSLVVVISALSSLVVLIVMAVVSSMMVALLISLIVVGIGASGFIWRIIHTIVSGGRERDIIGHTLFGIESGVFTIITGQWTPALALHLNNLFFWYLRDYLSANEFLRQAMFWLLLIVSSGLILGTWLYNNRLKKTKRRKKSITEKKLKPMKFEIKNYSLILMPVLMGTGFFIYQSNATTGIIIFISGLLFGLYAIYKIIKKR